VIKIEREKEKHDKHTKREQAVLSICKIKDVTVSYNSPFRGRPKEWKEIKVKKVKNETSFPMVENPKDCQGADKLWFRRSTLGGRARFYAHKSVRSE
jgi:hypothetical protein